MKSIRIKPLSVDAVSIDIVCDCGKSGLVNVATGERRWYHTVLTGGAHPSQSPTLECDCGKRYQAVSQADNIYVRTVSGS